MKLVVPMPPNRANARMNWRVALRHKKDYWARLNALYDAKRLPRTPETPLPFADVRVTAYVWGLCDHDNIVARLKPILDWMVGTGYLQGDSPRHIKLHMPEQVIDRRNPRIEIELEVAA